MFLLCMALSSFLLNQVSSLAAASYNPSVGRNADCDDKTLIMSKVRQAMQLSTLSSNNITAAHGACQQWSNILLMEHNDTSLSKFLDKNAILLCRALYANCLVRVGQDGKAIKAYDLALNDCATAFDSDNDSNHQKTMDDLLLGKAQALQRLLKYSEAIHAYRLLLSSSSSSSYSEKGAVGAAACSLRIGDIPGAKYILTKILNNNSKLTTCSAEVLGMIGTIEYIETGESKKALPLLLAGASESPLYGWIYGALLSSQQQRLTTRASQQEIITKWMGDNDKDSAFMELIKINLCPFDEDSLLELDDKINLHKLLTSSSSPHHGDDDSWSSSFWPTGAVFPREKAYLKDLANNDNRNSGGSSSSSSLWISKQRAGYGSHGNRILSNQQVLNEDIEMTEACLLLQRMVEPTLLLDGGRKFSLRIYVVYFSPNEVYLSSTGLVKLASVPMNNNFGKEEDDSSSIHMTNSGREAFMIQQDLQYLEKEFEKAGYPYGDFWDQLTFAVKQVFQKYGAKLSSEEQAFSSSSSSSWESRRNAMSIPKIMGLDFVVDKDRNPFLVEVNRFPGLEPRDSSDRGPKHQVVRDAWVCAGQRMHIVSHPLQSLLDKLEAPASSSSLERII